MPWPWPRCRSQRHTAQRAPRSSTWWCRPSSELSSWRNTSWFPQTPTTSLSRLTNPSTPPARRTPEGIAMSSTTRKLEKGLYIGTFHIPEHVSLGTWKILTCNQNSPRQPHSTEFEVKEYVLPSFEVVLTPTRKFFYLGDQSLTVAIAARFVFNEPVDGYALAIFGVRTETQKITLQSSLQRVEINEGRGVLTLRGQDLTSFDKPEDLLDAFIFVNVTVFSSGGEMGQAENSEVKIVSTPYSIRFIKTPGFFKPGMPFSFRVYVTNPDGSPAHNVPVCFRDQKHQTKEGLASMVINTERDSESLQLQVATCGSLAPPAQQANATKTIQAYKTQGSSRHLLHIGVEMGTVRVGQPLRIMLHPTHKSSAVQHFTILLLSKGRIVQARTQPHNPDSVMTALTMDVGPQLLPSFRIVAYQYLADSSELVADSLWVDVADVCMGTLSVGPQREADKGKVFLPHRQINLQVTGDAQAVVGLVAVDKALFVLNKKNQLTQKKVWDTVERQDIGCTAGSGRDHVGVFTDAGLDLATNLGISTTARTELHCPPTAARRRRRSLQMLQQKKNKVDQYQTALERRCCQAGIQENPMGHSCEQRTSRVLLGPPCVAAFLDCCRFARALNQEERTRLLLGKSSEDEECEDEECWDSPSVRSYFPESWLWERLVLTQADPLQPGLARHLFSKYLPDSITTWQILAVSLRKDKGICISEPYEVTVKIPLFVDLRLPFSVVRNEQVALRAVVYNYHEEDELQVYVMFPYHEQLCSLATKEKRFQQKLLVPRYSSRAVHFVVVPLELGTIQVEVQAWVRELSFRDTVRKNLNVQAGGEIQRLSRSIILDPKGKAQQALLKSHPLINQVPDTEAEVFISVQGDILGEMLVGGLQGTTLQKLITLPQGCVEQNIFSVTPNIILTHYLDTTKQWDQIGVERRSQAIQNIIQGYNQQLRFRAQDGSYKPYSGSTGSTWLTAYILKVFAMAASLKTPINHELLCASAQWLVDQKQDGQGDFREHAAIYTPAMQGGYKGSNADASLTAFVLIALKEAEPICGTHMNGLSSSLQKAQGYLERHLRRLQNPYSVAISSYALALVNSSMADAVLDNFADVEWTHWAVDKDTARSLYSIEATAYALLQKLTLGHLEKTQAIMQWLIERREFGGGYESTQTTVIGMQALALYRVAVPREKSIDLKVQVTAPARRLAEQWEINNNNAYLQRSGSKKFNAQDTLNITARGTGTGTVTLLTVYHRLPPTHTSDCKAFWLEATVEDVPEARKKSKYSNTFQLRIRTRSLGLRDATMTIIDISLLTGFEADLDDLKQLTNSVEQYIFLFESKSQLTNNSVILYLNEVSNRTDTEVAFRIHQQLEVGLLQPAVVTVYEYYEPSRRCSRFYNMSQHSELLKKICQEQVCKCAEENCLQMSSMRGLEKNALYAKACETGIDYVYKVQLEQQETQGSYVYYSMRVLAVIKAGTDMDVDNKVKRFVSHVACENVLGLREQQQYLLMGHTQDLWPTRDSYTYVLGKRSFIVPWPKQEEDGADRWRVFQSFSQFEGCDT
ncbi:complement C3-like isoform X2 [Emydura macquarii macquarii]|uniref:complement C3-like isoform X2 n=1 Tax=Emydura macquarii macquarii TaxID=1129001 RepID=UPI00352A8491